MSAEPRVAALVLAAGASARMGENKLLLRLEGEPLVRRAARRAVAAGAAPVVVVLGHDAPHAAAALADLDVALVVNPDPARGTASSLRCGIAALPAGAAGAVVVLADMPLVTSAMIAAVVARHRATGAPLVASDYGGVAAPPTLYARALLPELAAEDGDGAGKRVTRRHAAEAERVPCPAAALRDVDRPEDWAAIVEEVERGRESR